MCFSLFLSNTKLGYASPGYSDCVRFNCYCLMFYGYNLTFYKWDGNLSYFRSGNYLVTKFMVKFNYWWHPSSVFRLGTTVLEKQQLNAFFSLMPFALVCWNFCTGKIGNSFVTDRKKWEGWFQRLKPEKVVHRK